MFYFMLSISYKIYLLMLGMGAYACNPTTWEAEAGDLRVQDHPGL
jgi:hypothetical protein